MLKVNNKDKKTTPNIFDKKLVKTPNGCLTFALMSLLLTLNIFTPCSIVSIVNFEHLRLG